MQQHDGRERAQHQNPAAAYFQLMRAGISCSPPGLHPLLLLHPQLWYPTEPQGNPMPFLAARGSCQTNPKLYSLSLDTGDGGVEGRLDVCH